MASMASCSGLPSRLKALPMACLLGRSTHTSSMRGSAYRRIRFQRLLARSAVRLQRNELGASGAEEHDGSLQQRSLMPAYRSQHGC